MCQYSPLPPLLACSTRGELCLRPSTPECDTELTVWRVDVPTQSCISMQKAVL